MKRHARRNRKCNGGHVHYVTKVCIKNLNIILEERVDNDEEMPQNFLSDEMKGKAPYHMVQTLCNLKPS